jgi:hypothetical protein
MVFVVLIVLVALVGAAAWGLARRAKQVDEETSYLPGGGSRPVIGAAVWSRIRRGNRM